ncbi:MAG TPA: hypothetical protein VF588_02465 [Pyrinomonadaceae bacterium]|jgi:hypothetical protein
MKNAFRLLALAALATVFALPAYAQDAAATPAATPSGPCTEADTKAAAYKLFTDNFKGTPEQQKTAYESGKAYLEKYGTCPAAPDQQIAKYIQNWVTKYEGATVEFNFTKAVNENPTEAFRLSRDMLAKNPDNLKLYLQLVVAGLKNAQAKNNSTNAQAADAARRALALVEAGKTSDVWLPFTSQQEAAPGLNYYLGFFTLESSPAQAAPYLLKAAQSTSSFSKEPSTYDFLAAAYINSEFKPLAAEYKAKCEGKEASPECDALLNKINAVTHRVVDAYARAVALSPAGAAKDARRTNLGSFYKQLHDGSESGMNELVAGILAKPIMLPGQEPAPPAAAPSTTGTNGTSGAATTTQPAGATARPAANTTTTPAAKPATAQKPPRN